MARQLGFQRPRDAIGQAVQSGISRNPGTIVGVVRDYHSGSLHQVIPALFIVYEKSGSEISIKFTPSVRQAENLGLILSQVEKCGRAIYPGEKFSYHFLDDDIASLYQEEQRISALMRLAMIVAISISCMGLLALVTFTAEQRQKEISIRKVLGAAQSASSAC
jgi:putative ABC transport system permease protein